LASAGLYYADFGLCGVVLCGFWYALINSYRDLNSGKFAVIHELEQKLPARLYAAEWIGMGKVEKQSGYIPFTHIEVWIPVVFIVIYLFVMMSLLSAFSARTPAPPTPMPVIIVTATPLSTTPEAIIMPLPTNTP